MKKNYNIEKHSKISSQIQKLENQVVFVNNILSDRNLNDLLYDRNRILKAIDLAINARLYIDPYYDPYEIDSINKDELAEDILNENINCRDFSSILSIETINIPKDRQSSRIAKYFNIKDYSIRYLLALIFSEKINYPEFIFGGKSDIFSLDYNPLFERIILDFHNHQNSLIINNEFEWLVYIDIERYYDNINNDILINILQRKLHLTENDPIIKLSNKYFSDINLGCLCDNFIQNIYFNDLDSILSSHSWKYFRMTDDIRVFCKSKEEADLALQIIISELKKLNLSINKEKLFITIPEKSINNYLDNIKKYSYIENDISDFKRSNIHKIHIENTPKRTPILNINNLNNYSVENLFLLDQYSPKTVYYNKYRFKHPKYLTFKDEVSEKSGYKINDNDVYDIFKILTQKSNLNIEELNTLKKIIFETYTPYLFSKKTIRLFLVNAFKKNNTELSDVLYKLSKDYKNNSETYLSYIFLKVIFFENIIKHDYSLSVRISIWNWIFELIKYNNNTYIRRTIQYIIEHNLFEIVHPSYGNILKLDFFWQSIDLYFMFSKGYEETHGCLNIQDTDNIFYSIFYIKERDMNFKPFDFSNNSLIDSEFINKKRAIFSQY